MMIHTEKMEQVRGDRLSTRTFPSRISGSYCGAGNGPASHVGKGCPASIVAVMLMTLLGTTTEMAQGQDGTTAKDRSLGTKFVPANAVMAGLLSPAKTLASPTLQLFPTEIAEAWCIENIGAPLSQLETVKLVISAPGPGELMHAAIFKFRKDVEIGTLHPQVVGDELEIDGYACVEVNGPPGVVLYQLAADTIVASSINYLDAVVKATGDQPSGPLAKLAAGVPHRGNLTILFAVEPVRPLITEFLQSQKDQIPPPFVEFTKVPELLDAILLRVDLENRASGVHLVLLGRDDASTEQLEQIIASGLKMGRAMAMQQAVEKIRGQGAVPDAMREYAERVADDFVKTMMPKRKGRRLTFTAPVSYVAAYQAAMFGGFATTLRAPGFARLAARKKRSNLMQIGLAMHNHHSAYKTLPGHATRDDAGKPLLSWRVKILPFLEEQELYSQFNLDEPWDSEHNIKLLDKMPQAYRHPVFETEAGKTVYQAPLGDSYMFKSVGARKFRDVLDGLANSIMIVETDTEAAVNWTEPADWEVDEDEPFMRLGFNAQGKITVLMADGATLQLSPEIGVDMLHRLLTIRGKELINLE